MPQRNASANHVAVRLQKARSAAVSPFTRLGKSKADWAARASTSLEEAKGKRDCTYQPGPATQKAWFHRNGAVRHQQVEARVVGGIFQAGIAAMGWTVSSCKRSNGSRVP
jgi:hypothetical protein